MIGAVYLLCAATACFCAVKLLQAYRSCGTRLLLWAGLCFLALTLREALVLTDILVLPNADLFLIRNSLSVIAAGLMLYGILWEAD